MAYIEVKRARIRCQLERQQFCCYYTVYQKSSHIFIVYKYNFVKS